MKGYLTPDNLPVDDHCRTFRIPDDVQWLSVFMGALLPLIYPENWQQSGSLTPDESAEVMLNVLWDAYERDYGICPVLPTPFWDTVVDVDDEYPEGTLTPWYGTAIVTYHSPPEVTFVEQLSIWAIAGFIAYAGSPAAAIAYLTIAPKFVIALKTGNLGAIVDIIVDASRVGRVDTYSASPGIIRVPIVANPDLDEHQIYLVKDDDPDTIMQVVRDELNPADVSPPNVRYVTDTDQVQTLNPDDTWRDNNAADPRSSPVYLYSPVEADDPQCQAAANMTRWLNNLIDEVLTVMAVANDAAGLLTVMVGLLLELGPFGILIDLVLAVAFILFSAGATAVAAAFTNDVYDQLTCIFYCRISSDGLVTVEQLELINTDIDEQIGGLVATILHAMFFLMGHVGLSNAGTIGDAPADCSSCACEWCRHYDAAHDLETSFPAAAWGVPTGQVFVPGVGWQTTNGLGWFVQYAIPAGVKITRANIRYYTDIGSRTVGYEGWVNPATGPIPWTETALTPGPGEWQVEKAIPDDPTVAYLQVELGSSGWLYDVWLYGTSEDQPTDGEEC